MDPWNETDDFWNESTSKKFNFNDEEDESIGFSEISILKPLVEEVSALSIHSLISNKSLETILSETNETVQHITPPPIDSIRKLFNGESIILNIYRTLEDKLLLLDSAIEVGDGDIILKIVIFLKKTVKYNIFVNQLSKRKIAARHYINYLLDRNDLVEIINFYVSSGDIFNLKDVYYILCRNITNAQTLYKKLNQFSIDHAQNMYCAEDKLQIHENISFLDLQIKNNFNCDSLIDCLIQLFTNGTSVEKIVEIKNQFNLDDSQYDWFLMNMYCKGQKWDKLIENFIKTAWVLKKRTLKSAVRADLLILGINKHDPPKSLLEQFLPCVTDSRRSLSLAEKMGLHSFIVNYFVDQKDRVGLLKYMDRVSTDKDALELVQSALNTKTVKWKN